MKEKEITWGRSTRMELDKKKEFTQRIIVAGDLAAGRASMLFLQAVVNGIEGIGSKIRKKGLLEVCLNDQP